MTETVLVSTWADGLFAIGAGAPTHELAGKPVRGLAPDGAGGALAIVEQHTLRRRSAGGRWSTLASWPAAALSCCVAVADRILVGTDDARVLVVEPGGSVEPLPAFDHVEGRESWVAGTAIIDGKEVGPPLGVRSISATPDGSVVLANVHVGGIPRSTDGGRSWHPTIDVEADVHEVRIHPTRPELAVAAGAAGLCTSRDGGATWSVDAAGLHASYCSAVAFAGDDVLVAASAGHFAAEGALYRCAITDPPSPPARVRSGLPPWLSGIVDTGCIATRGACVAAVDRAGSVYFSADAAGSFHVRADGLPAPSSLLIV